MVQTSIEDLVKDSIKLDYNFYNSDFNPDYVQLTSLDVSDYQSYNKFQKTMMKNLEIYNFPKDQIPSMTMSVMEVLDNAKRHAFNNSSGFVNILELFGDKKYFFVIDYYDPNINILAIKEKSQEVNNSLLKIKKGIPLSPQERSLVFSGSGKGYAFMSAFCDVVYPQKYDNTFLLVLGKSLN